MAISRYLRLVLGMSFSSLAVFAGAPHAEAQAKGAPLPAQVARASGSTTAKPAARSVAPPPANRSAPRAASGPPSIRAPSAPPSAAPGTPTGTTAPTTPPASIRRVASASPAARSERRSGPTDTGLLAAHLTILDNTARVRGLKDRLAKLPKDYALVIHKTDTHALLLTRDGFRYAAAARPTVDRITRPRYNGTMYSEAWVETWKVPWVRLGTKGGALDQLSPPEIEHRIDELAAKPTWGEPNAWNPVTGSSGTDVALFRRTLAAP